jgi:GntR family transcriptional repressor for pyruvate dehydrogenase complex
LLPTIKRQNIYEQIVDHLRKYIIDNGLRPGDPLPTELELAKQLRVSRQSVREAVKVLTSVGVIETRPRDGSRLREANTQNLAEHLRFVFALKGATFRELIETRIVMECAFLPIIMAKADEIDFRRMEAAIEKMRANRENLKAFTQADMEFHQALVNATKNRVMAGFGVMLQEFFRKMLEERGTSIHMEISHKTIADHEGILSALRKKDLPEAQRIMQTHLAVYEEGH